MLLLRAICRPLQSTAPRQVIFGARMSSSASMDIATATCEPCKGDSPSILPKDYSELLSQISPEWRIEPFEKYEAPALQRDFKFKNFKYALQFGNAIGEIAETKGIKHHPAIVIEWGRVTCAWWTHAIGGVSGHHRKVLY